MTSQSTPTQSASCIFCGGRPLSNEHVFRDTLRKHFPKKPATLLWSEADPGRNKEMPISMFDRKVGAVCRSCNHGWLNDLDLELEDLLVDLFRAKPRRISRAELSRLAYWAAVRAAVRSQAEGEPTKVAVAGYAGLTKDLGLPPEGTTVWIGLTAIPATLDAFRHDGLQVIKNDGSVRAVHHVFQHTVAMDRVLFLVFASANAGVGAVVAGHVGRGLDEVIQASPVPMTRIWPQPRPIQWPSTPPVPPEVVLTELRRLATTFMKASIESQDE